MAKTYSVKEIIGKRLYLKKGKSVIKYNQIRPQMIEAKTVSGPAYLGKVTYFVELEEGLYWLLDDKTFVRHSKELYDIRKLREQGARTEAEIKEEEERKRKEEEERKEKENETFGEQALDTLQTTVLIGLGLYLGYKALTGGSQKQTVQNYG